MFNPTGASGGLAVVGVGKRPATELVGTGPVR
jgi:hypothetical protein